MRSFHTFPHRFIGFSNTSVFLSCVLQLCDRFPCASLVESCKALQAGIGTSNFLRAWCPWILHHLDQINEVNTTQFSSVVKFRLFDSPLSLFFAFRRVRHIFPNLWPQSVWPGGRLFPRQSLPPDHVYQSGGFSSNTVNLVQPVHVSDNSRSPSTFQLSSMFFLQHYIQGRICCPGNVDMFKRKRKGFFSARTVWLWVPRDDGR